MTTREQVMKYFRANKYIEQFSNHDRYEIALCCLCHSDALYTNLERDIKKYEAGEYSNGGSYEP
jgi:hypothetical protein